MPKKHLQIVLSYLQCNETQQEIYMACLQHGPITIKELTELLGHNRVTIHSAVGELIKKGLFYETWKGKKRYIVSEGIRGLDRLFQNKKAELQSIETTLKLAEDTITLLNLSQKNTRPAIKFYEGVVGFRKMLEETLESRDYVYLIHSAQTFSHIVDQDYFLQYFERRAQKGIITKAVWPTCDFAKIAQKRSKANKMHIRVLPPEIQWNAGIFSWNEKVALLSFSKQQYLTTTIIENDDIAYLFQHVLFEYVFAQGKVPSAFSA